MQFANRRRRRRMEIENLTIHLTPQKLAQSFSRRRRHNKTAGDLVSAQLPVLMLARTATMICITSGASY